MCIRDRSRTRHKPRWCSTDPNKIAAVEKFPAPQNVKLKSFLGLAGYYRKFIKDFAKIAKPLNNLFKDGVELKWE